MDHNINITTNSNISKTVSINVTRSGTFLKEYLISFLMVPSLIEFAILVLQLFMFKDYGNIGISKIEFLNFSGTEKVKKG